MSISNAVSAVFYSS